LRLAEREAPSPGPGEVVVAVEAAGVNFADTLMVAGKYQEKPPFPFTPGLEAAGRIKAIGAEARGLTVGQRVMALCDHGAFAEEMLARESDVLPIPPSMDWTTAAGFPIAYGTAHGALTWHAGLQAGQTLLVHGAGGGVGLAAVEVGKALGARVIATAGGAAKLGLAEAHGADALIDSRQEDIRARVLALTDGRGADVVLDPVGGEVFEASLRATAWGGRILVWSSALPRARCRRSRPASCWSRTSPPWASTGDPIAAAPRTWWPPSSASLRGGSRRAGCARS
jgi:NADPH2:quinone reductase